MDRIPLVKFFITGRPERQIRSGFRLVPLRPITKVLGLHKVPRSLVDIGIKLFLRIHLAVTTENRSHCDVAEDWPLSSDIDVLCEKAACLFVYASTVVKFVVSRHHRPLITWPAVVSWITMVASENVEVHYFHTYHTLMSNNLP